MLAPVLSWPLMVVWSVTMATFPSMCTWMSWGRGLEAWDVPWAKPKCRATFSVVHFTVRQNEDVAIGEKFLAIGHVVSFFRGEPVVVNFPERRDFIATGGGAGRERSARRPSLKGQVLIPNVSCEEPPNDQTERLRANAHGVGANPIKTGASG